MKTVLITGGTSGIGRELANIYKNEGYQVYAVGLDPNPLDKNEYFCDVTNINSIQNIADKFEHLDLLICSAGFGISGSLELTGADIAKKLFDVNYFGVLNTCQVCLPKIQKHSKIIVIGSCCGLFALPFRAHYCASKSAINMFANGLRMELSKTDIDVTVVNPGDVKTEFIQNRIKNFETNERYQNRVKNAQEVVESKNDKRMSVKFCARKIFKICKKKNLKASYIIGFKYKVLNFFAKIMPKNIFLNITNKFMGGMWYKNFFCLDYWKI